MTVRKGAIFLCISQWGIPTLHGRYSIIRFCKWQLWQIG